jgi:hypothetical protein
MRYWMSVGVLSLLTMIGMAQDKKPEAKPTDSMPTPERLAGLWAITLWDGIPVWYKFAAFGFTADGKAIYFDFYRLEGFRLFVGTYRLRGRELLCDLHNTDSGNSNRTPGYIEMLANDKLIIRVNPNKVAHGLVLERVPVKK